MSDSVEYEYVNLKDGSDATIFYLSHSDISKIPDGILNQMQDIFNDVIEEGQTYPYVDKVNTFEEFQHHWLEYNFMVLTPGKTSLEAATEVLGTCRVQPNYPGRCSHVSNGAFLVSSKARGKGLGKVLGEAYIRWAPKLGYTSSVFNLVFKTNVASWKLWDSLGFTRIGTVPKVARLKGYDELVDAYIYGMDFS